jgi:hypothetical protein
MWPIDTFDIISLRRGTGDRLTALVDDLIRAECLFATVPQASVHTNLRTNLGDRGVDTRVADGAPSEITGWLREPSIWQYKAVAYADLTEGIRQAEIEKDYSAECIRQGHAYRFVVADDMPPATKQEWEADFARWATALFAGARTPAVLNAGDLAAWAIRYPAVIARHFANRVAPNALHIDSWGDSIRTLTPGYVHVPARENIEVALTEHVDFRHNPADPVFVMQGEAGVGKTRLAYETLNRRPEGTLLVYTLDAAAAVDMSYRLANDRTLRAVLVSDECDADTRYRLKSILQGHTSRVRVIAIDNTGVRTPQSIAPEYWLESVPDEIVESVLARNYPAVPQDRRRAYASLAGGFITLAADLCHNDAVLAASPGIHALPVSVYDYYRGRLRGFDRDAMETLALVRTVGYSEERAGELQVLCGFTGQDVQRVRETLLRLHDAPGFVGRGGRLLYVTPQIIAQVAFEHAWGRWAAHDPAGFLSRMPGQLLDSFLERVKTTASTEVRDVVAAYFRTWLVGLTPDVLADGDAVDRLIALAEANPNQVLPEIGRLVRDATSTQLEASTGDYHSGWGPRRRLVWLCENHARFPDFFFECEEILLKLAVHETEKNISNSATGVWTHLYNIFLSGTPVPFPERLALLRTRLHSSDSATAALALKALDAALDPHAFGLVPAPVIGGRLTPPSWEPRTRGEARECERAAFAELAKVIEVDIGNRDQALKIAIDRLYTLIADGLVEECIDALRGERLSPELRADLINNIERILARERRVGPNDRLSSTAVDRLGNWMLDLRPQTFHERLVAALALDPWRKQRDEVDEDWRAELDALAEMLLNDVAVIDQELRWLLSRAARSSVYFGERVGQRDADARVFELLREAMSDAEDFGFARGYINGLLELRADAFARAVNAWLDDLTDQNPQAAYEVSVAAADHVSGFDRVVEMVANNKLAGAYLRVFSRQIGTRHPSELDLRRMLTVLTDRALNGDQQSAEAALDIVGFWLHQREGQLAALSDETLALLWAVAEFGAKDPGQESYDWQNLLLALTPKNPIRVAEIAIQALLSERIAHHDEADQVLVQAAALEPDAVMELIGRAALDPAKGWRLGIGKHGFHAISPNVVLGWVRQNGLEAARAAARHLPPPHLQDGKPVVPDLTAQVLGEFGSDDEVFSEFCVGVHDGEVHVGEISQKYESEAALAAAFLKHPIPAIRRWAETERDSGLRHAEMWRQHEQERRIR